MQEVSPDSGHTENSLPNHWTPAESGFARLGPGTRLELRISKNQDTRASEVGACDIVQESKAFANDVLAILGDHLTPRKEKELMRGLALSLIERQRARGVPDGMEDSFGEFLAELQAIDRTPPPL